MNSVRELGDHLTDTEAESWMLELSEANAESWRRAAQELGPKLSNLETPDHLIWAALQDWLKAQHPESARTLRTTLTPCQAHWLELCTTAPLGFTRLVVETGRQRSLRDPHTHHIHSKKIQKLLAIRGLSLIDRQEYGRIRGLSMAYYADDLIALGSPRQAANALHDAHAHLAGLPADDEEATVLQIDAQRRWNQNRGRTSLALLTRAAQLLENCQVEGRWSELQLSRGRLHLFFERPTLAIAPLTDALNHLPPNLAYPIRADILITLASCLLRLHRYQDAERRLQEANHFLAGNGRDEELYAQQQFLRGRIALRTHRPYEAITRLHQAVDILDRLRRPADLVVALRDLIHAYIENGRSLDLSKLAKRYQALLARPEFRTALQARYPQDAATAEFLHRAEGLSQPELLAATQDESEWIH